jgi:hypothetical protein
MYKTEPSVCVILLSYESVGSLRGKEILINLKRLKNVSLKDENCR